jgi:hypothetical protein
MQCLEVSGAVRPIYGSLGVKRLRSHQGVSGARGGAVALGTEGSIPSRVSGIFIDIILPPALWPWG